ncbi:MAG: SDR family oxidoreductase [Saprospiraceae bacterium]
MYYNNKIVWITGGSSGIGEAMTKQLNEAGATVIISSRRMEELQRVKKSCKYPEKVECVILDVTDIAAVNQTAEKLLERHHKIDISILNAGVSQRSLAVDTAFSVDRRLMNINYFGAISVAKALLPSMIQHQLGHFIVISSLSGKFGVSLRTAYAASKHALHGFFDSLRAEVHEHNIKVTLICPGYIRTNISVNALVGEGQKHGVMDQNQNKGLTAEAAAKKILRAAEKGKREIAFGGKEVIAVYLKRFFPSLLAKILQKERAK